MKSAPIMSATLALALAACASVDTETPIAKADAAIADAQRSGAARLATAQLDSAHAQLAEARLLAEDGDDEEARLLAERARADANEALAISRSVQADSSQSEAAALAAANAALSARLEALEAEVTDRGTVVTLGDVLFETDEAALTPAGLTRVQRIAAYLRAHPGEAVVIEGHADARGPARYNQGLSERRAAAVADALLAQGVDTPRIVYSGLGESSPIASNASATGRQLNRRVEVIFVERG
ncbi:OmpA family protein [Paralimibaculum aggregatum]|uniref:OmpA family protein n=1 Tax=Paralimibaculum aggregatum TaxID=3036245 RepID=A0ABQ6LHU7_9RHOB|nr:OmpA family protein [Limibaculum sp. NKW23]GMG82860.1 OmpA family protein [Limibaculum sp. NKW23]